MSQPLEVSDPAEGSVEWSKAQQHMLGQTDPDGDAAGEDAPQPEAAKQPREFKYRGKTVSVDAETYEVLEGLRREARGANGRLGSELARTRERLAKVEGMLTSARPTSDRQDDEIKPPDPLLATRDIAAWQQQMDLYQQRKMERHVQRLEEKYRGEVREIQERVSRSRAEEEWANRFYDSYDHLDHPKIKPIVSQVYTEHAEELEALKDSPEEAYELLADLTDRRLVEIKNAGKVVEQGDDTNPKRRRPPRIESSAGPTPRQKAPEAPREFSAGRWVAEQRQRMAGRAPKK